MKTIHLVVCLAFLLVSAAVSANGIVEVSIKKFKYIPAVITVQKGTTIRWLNNEKRQYHNVWFEQMGEAEPDYFFPEESYEKTFDSVGAFPYHCGPHPEMIGEVIVTD